MLEAQGPTKRYGDVTAHQHPPPQGGGHPGTQLPVQGASAPTRHAEQATDREQSHDSVLHWIWRQCVPGTCRVQRAVVVAHDRTKARS